MADDGKTDEPKEKPTPGGPGQVPSPIGEGPTVLVKVELPNGTTLVHPMGVAAIGNAQVGDTIVIKGDTGVIKSITPTG